MSENKKPDVYPGQKSVQSVQFEKKIRTILGLRK